MKTLKSPNKALDVISTGSVHRGVGSFLKLLQTRNSKNINIECTDALINQIPEILKNANQDVKLYFFFSGFQEFSLNVLQDVYSLGLVSEKFIIRGIIFTNKSYTMTLVRVQAEFFLYKQSAIEKYASWKQVLLAIIESELVPLCILYSRSIEKLSPTSLEGFSIYKELYEGAKRRSFQIEEEEIEEKPIFAVDSLIAESSLTNTLAQAGIDSRNFVDGIKSIRENPRPVVKALHNPEDKIKEETKSPISPNKTSEVKRPSTQDTKKKPVNVTTNQKSALRKEDLILKNNSTGNSIRSAKSNQTNPALKKGEVPISPEKSTVPAVIAESNIILSIHHSIPDPPSNGFSTNIPPNTIENPSQSISSTRIMPIGLNTVPVSAPSINTWKCPNCSRLISLKAFNCQCGFRHEVLEKALTTEKDKTIYCRICGNQALDTLCKTCKRNSVENITMGTDVASSSIITGSIECAVCREVCVGGVCKAYGKIAGIQMDADYIRENISKSEIFSGSVQCQICGKFSRERVCKDCEEKGTKERESAKKVVKDENLCVVCSMSSEKNICRECLRKDYWECVHCTFANHGGNVCDQCSKTNMQRPRNKSSLPYSKK